MKKKHRELLEYLLNTHSTITSKELANALHISARSVKNYVLEINLLSNEKVILSSKSGYQVHAQAAHKVLAPEEEQIPQTWEERSLYIIKQLMLEHSSHVDIYSLCEELFVGYSTLKADIAKMNKAYTNFNVHFACENDAIYIRGDEKNIRKLISYLVQEETSQQLVDLSILKESFHAIEIDKVASIIRKTFQKYNYYINDFSFVNLLLHFVIIIDRIQNGNVVISKDDEFIIESAHEQALIEELCEHLDECFEIHLTPSERFEIYMLFKTNANYSLPNSDDTLRKIVGDEILKETKHIADKVNEDYYIDLHTEGFLTPFSLHIKNLIVRAQNKTYTKNPMAESIKNTCPTVYDIAINISLELMEHYHIHINEDEVAFLALHIGAEIERQKSNDAKIQCVLLCPDYMQLTSELYNQLLINFGNQINIIKTISFEDELKGLSYQMVISTIAIHRKLHHQICMIPPLSTRLNLATIQTAIDACKANEKRYILKKNFKEFFFEELFMITQEQKTRDDILHTLTNKMVALEFVDHDFENNVMVRETAASTAFGNIAIPHSMKMEAMKTCIGVVISPTGVLWDEHLVHVILLVAINKIDKRIFHDLYETLVLLFSEQSMIEQAKDCRNFKDFENLVYANISSLESES
ncbi:MAG: PRD domain-containing protein [Longicatena sp.]